MTPSADYLEECRRLVDNALGQADTINQAADWFAKTILAGRMVHLFGSGHSRIMVEEMWPRYGSFPGFNPIVELSLTFHNSVVGANGQRQAMFIENTPGLAKRILRELRFITNRHSARRLVERLQRRPDRDRTGVSAARRQGRRADQPSTFRAQRQPA